MVTPIGLVIKEIAREKKLNPTDLSEKIGKGRTYAYDTFKRNAMSAEEIEQWADILNVSVTDILGRQFGRKLDGLTAPAADSDLLRKYIKQLEDRIAEQSRLLSAMMGKSEPVSASAGFAPRVFLKAPSGTNLGTGRILSF